MSTKKRIDKIFTAVHERVKDEIGVLLGVEFSLSGARNTLVSKEDFFESLAGKQILVKIDIVGDLEGVGCLVLGIKDAIRLGGTLIMLPASELEEVVGREEYTEETEDSYGEIANIITGSYTKVFEEMYPKNCRFIRKEQEILVPAKVVAESDQPVLDQQYYQVSCTMLMEGRQMGDIHMLVPAGIFGLQADQSAAAAVKQPEEPEVVIADGDAASPVKSSLEDISPAENRPADRPAPEAPSKPEEVKRKKAVDPVKHLKRIDKLLAACEKKLTEEVSSLLGSEVKFLDLKNGFISKEDFFFEEVEGKQVMADMDVTGDLKGKSYFFAGLKGAIHLGGVMIMLPPTELENVVADEEFGEDVKDAYGEVANIVSGVFTSVFEEQYPEKIRFVKKGLQQIIPMKVDAASDEPVPDQQYYMSSMLMQSDGRNLGKVHMLFPAALLSLEQAVQAAEEEDATPAQTVAKKTSLVSETEEATETIPESARAASPAVERDPGFDAVKHRKRVDRLLKECKKKMQADVGALIDTEITLDEMENRLISKEEFFFEVAAGRQMMTNMDVVGELEGKSYLFFNLKDAIRLGGLLVMLPPAELESVVAEEKITEDTKDAFGEIANIISGVYTAVFEEQYTRKIRFVRTDLEQISPMKVDPESDKPIPDQEYYLSSMSLFIEGRRLGRVNLLFPAGLLQIEDVAKVVEPQQVATGIVPTQAFANEGRRTIDILLISDDESEADRIAAAAEAQGYGVRQVSFKDNIKSAITDDLRAVYIVMRDVNEQAFGIAIKVSSSCSMPLIAAGPDWTRTKVIKAVKYGVNDILLTPATAEDIQENLENNLVSMAA